MEGTVERCTPSRSWLQDVLGEGKEQVESGFGRAHLMGPFTELRDLGRWQRDGSLFGLG